MSPRQVCEALCQALAYENDVMKVLVLDGSTAEDAGVLGVAGTLKELLIRSGHQLEWMELRGMTLDPCAGCTSCWDRTPGICVKEDDGRTIGGAWMSSDLVILLGRITFGGYPSLLKRALDRQAGLLLPYYLSGKEGVVHMPRYERYPSILAIGVCSEYSQEEDETFKRIVAQNGMTFKALHTRVKIVCAEEREETTREIIESSVMGMKVRR
ncbi:MAG: Iron-sulfur flavoprotein [Methanomassiliicoccales archaeon PtaU1.Bin124]|nr:MAG: Iron-sulfur flavoprotein [Methanomassiliicoccales archaeon PtaU1.Bin124]